MILPSKLNREARRNRQTDDVMSQRISSVVPNFLFVGHMLLLLSSNTHQCVSACLLKSVIKNLVQLNLFSVTSHHPSVSNKSLSGCLSCTVRFLQ